MTNKCYDLTNNFAWLQKERTNLCPGLYMTGKTRENERKTKLVLVYTGIERARTVEMDQ